VFCVICSGGKLGWVLPGLAFLTQRVGKSGLEMQEEYIVCDDLGPRTRNVNIIVKVVNKGEEREVSSRWDNTIHRLSEATVGDETGVVLLSLWDDMIDKVEVGKTYKITNGYTSLFKGNIRLNIGRYGTIEEVSDKEIREVNEANNKSEKEYPSPPRGYRKPRTGGGGYQRGYTPRKRY